MKEITKKQSRRIGFALVLVVVMLVILFIIGLALLRLGLGARLLAVRASAQIAARCAADSGLNEAVSLMKRKMISEPIWDNSSLPERTDADLPNCYANYSYGTTGDPCNGFVLSSTGTSGVAEEIVYCEVLVQSAFVGIAVKETIDIRVGAQFGTIPEGSSFVLRTDSTESGAISLKSGLVIPGDVIVGPGGDPDTVINMHDTVVITGDVYAAPVELYFPPVTPPEFTGPDTAIKVDDKHPLTIVPAGNGRYRSIDIKQHQTLEISGGDVVLYVTGDVKIGGGSEDACKISIKAGSSLELYLGGNLYAGQGAGIMHEGITSGSPLEDIAAAAMNLKIYGTDSCKLIQLKKGSEPYYGAMYAPNADLQLYNSGDLAGAFVGNSVRMFNSSGVFYYIPALGQVGIDDETAFLAVVRWWE